MSHHCHVLSFKRKFTGAARNSQQAEDLLCLGVTFLFLLAQQVSEMLLQGLKREGLELSHTPEGKKKKDGVSGSYC